MLSLITHTQKFKPLCLTVLGAGGTGKSVLINTLVSCIHNIFQDNNSVFVTAPTGAAAFNVGGTTIHKEFKIRVTDITGHDCLGDGAKQQLQDKLQRTIAIIFDERSMISQQVFGTAERNVKETAHNGGHDTEDWGGIPIVILFGDDYQLPPIGLGAIDSFRNQGKNKTSQNGAKQFINLGRKTMELTIQMRQNEEQNQLHQLLKHYQVGSPRKEDEDVLLELHLNSGKLTQSQVKKVKEAATYIFANKKEMNEHNWEKLREEHSPTNPVARIQSQTTSKGIKYKGCARCIIKESDVEPILNICRAAKVQITGENFEPDWGLFNGSIGKVIEIIYDKGASPLDGTLPKFIITDFPTYPGPAWITDNPTWVPMPTIEIKCS